MKPFLLKQDMFRLPRQSYLLVCMAPKTARIFSVSSNSALDNGGSLLLFAFPEHRPAMQVKLVDLSS
jgi:hypothetical protein